MTPRNAVRLTGFTLVVAAVTFGAPACGSSSQPATPTIAPAKTFQLVGFQPSGPIKPGVSTEISFKVQQPSGAPLTKFKRGAGPHTGVHMIFVRDDLASIIHRHPAIAPDGTIRQAVTFPAPGRYRLILDVYPALAGPLRNFQLFGNVTVAGSYKPAPLPAYKPTLTVGGFRFTMAKHAQLKAIEPAFLTLTVRDAQGRPGRFSPWFGALAHAIFVRSGSLDYFHTHVCSPGASGCTSALGGASVSGTSTKPGVLRVGVLLPLPGRWRLFLQTKVNGRVLTAPFTLDVK